MTVWLITYESIWYVEATWSGIMICRSNLFWLTPSQHHWTSNPSRCLTSYRIPWYLRWLVVSPPLKNISQWEGLTHILWKIKNVPNHQTVRYSGSVRNIRVWDSLRIKHPWFSIDFPPIQFIDFFWLRDTTTIWISMLTWTVVPSGYLT